MKRVKLGDVCDVRDGTHDSPKYLKVNGYPLITSKNISNGRLTFDNVNFISKEDYDAINKRSKVNKGDILMPMIGTIGNPVLITDEPNFAIKNVALIKSDSSIILNKFILHYLNSNCFNNWKNNINRGGTQKFVSLSDIRSMLIPLPPFSDQIRIAEILDKVKSIIDVRKKQIEKCDEYIKSMFYTMFGDPVDNKKGWIVKTLDDVCNKITDGEHINPIFINDGIRMVMANNVRDYLDFKGCKYISKNDYKKFSKKCNPELGDVLLVSRGATIGRACINNSLEKFCLMGSVILLRPKNDIILDYYLLCWLKNEKIRPYIFTTSSASAQQAIYIKDLKKRKIICPPMSIQTQFAAIVQKTEAHKELLKKSLAKVKILFDCLMDKNFY